MELIEQIISAISEPDQIRFREHLRSLPNGQKALRLFEHLMSGKKRSKKDLVALMFKPPSVSMYDKLVERLTTWLQDFLMQGEFDNPTSKEGEVQSLAYFAGKDLKEKNYDAAWKKLQKAVALAEKHQMQTMLPIIYDTIISNSIEIGLNLKEQESFINKKNRIAPPKFKNNMLVFATVSIITEEMKQIKADHLPYDRRTFFNSAILGFSFMDLASSLKDPEPGEEKPIPLHNQAFPAYLVGIYEKMLENRILDEFPKAYEVTVLFCIAFTMLEFRREADAAIWLRKITGLASEEELRRHVMYDQYVQLREELAEIAGGN